MTYPTRIVIHVSLPRCQNKYRTLEKVIHLGFVPFYGLVLETGGDSEVALERGGYEPSKIIFNTEDHSFRILKWISIDDPDDWPLMLEVIDRDYVQNGWKITDMSV